MKKQIKNVFYCFFFSLVMVSGFFHYNQLEYYAPEAPPHIGSILEPYKDHGVHVRAKAYSAAESHKYLKRNLLSKGMQPVQITIQNNSAKSLYLSTQSVDVDSLSASSVANRVHRSYIPRSIGFKVAAFFFWPFMIPSAIDSILTYSHHKKMKRDYAAKSLKDEGEVLVPYSTTHRVIFVRSQQLQEDLTLYLRDAGNGHYYSLLTKVEMS